MASALLRWWRIGSPARSDALGACVWLLAARTATRLVPYSAVRRLVVRLPTRRVRSRSMTARECGIALGRATGVMPGSSCLARAIAGACLLRRHGHPAMLTIGVGFAEDQEAVTPRRGFLAHAWVESDGIIVAGAEQIASCRPLLCDAIPSGTRIHGGDRGS